MATFLVILTGLVTAIIMRPPSDEPKRWGLVRGWSGAATATFACAGVVAVDRRGYSVSSLVLLALGLLTTGTYVLLVARLRVGKTDVQGTPVVYAGSSGLRSHNVRLQRVLVVWCVCMFLGALVPLRYGGFFLDAPVMSRVVGGFTGGRFEPLAERRAIDVGQCLRNWEVAKENIVVPCGTEHQAEVVASVDATESCPGTGDFDSSIAATVESLVVVDGLHYCVLRPSNARQSWEERVPRKNELVPTP